MCAFKDHLGYYIVFSFSPCMLKIGTEHRKQNYLCLPYVIEDANAGKLDFQTYYLTVAVCVTLSLPTVEHRKSFLLIP